MPPAQTMNSHTCKQVTCNRRDLSLGGIFYSIKFKVMYYTALLILSGTLVFSAGAVVYAQSSYSSVNGQLLKGVPEACFRIIGPAELTFPNEKIESSGTNLSARQRAIEFRDEVTSQIQEMLERFRIPIAECTADSFKSMANIGITVGFHDGLKDDRKSHARVDTRFYDFVKSIHTNKISKAMLFSSHSSSKALPDDAVVGFAFDEVRQ